MSFTALARERPSLPLWGRWQPEGLTEEGGTTLIYRYGSANANLSRPRLNYGMIAPGDHLDTDPLRGAPRSATLPKGEGLRLRRIVV